MLWVALAEGVVALWFGLPFLAHRQRCAAAMKSPWTPKTEPLLPEAMPEVVVLVPTWNESGVIERRLADLAAQHIEGRTLADAGVRMVLIDSASEDGTAELAEAWMNDHNEAFAGHAILRMERREGKTAAVQRALAHIREQSPDAIVVMVDADARCSPGALEALVRAMAEKNLGAVGARPERQGTTALEASHRGLFSWLREAESSLGATPFLEGSLMAFRADLVDPASLDSTSNADDAQIATMIAVQGFRTAQHPTAGFIDDVPTTWATRWDQRVRRGRGLVRLLRRQRHVRTPEGFAQTLRFQRHAHLRAPFLLLAGWQLAEFRWGLGLHSGVLPWETPLGAVLTVFEGMALLMLVTGLIERPWFKPFRGLSTVVGGMIPLWGAWWREWFGGPAHLWTPNAEARQREK
jgi:cellulose synthase/poly-beta-1,6-N-acetylglucosamine synthase-like glycosyltransferase